MDFSTFDFDNLGKIRRHHWKERLKISKITKFESDLLKNNEESRRFTDVFNKWWRAQTCPPPNKRLWNFHNNFA